MTRWARHSVRRAALALGSTVLVFLLAGWWPTAASGQPGAAARPSAARPSAARPSASQPATDSVTVTVMQLSPTTPIASATARPITVELRLTNTTSANLGPVTVQGARGNPINNKAALDAAIASPAAPDPSLTGTFASKKPVTATLAAGASTTVEYASTTANSSAAGGLCLCENRIYPLYFTVINAQHEVLGSTQTYLPSFTAGSTPSPVQVSWVWPILERPHRSTRDTVFTDDDLAQSVATGGRLDRVLQVVELVGPTTPMTLVIDPDLIDELAVMASGTYTVESGTGPARPGTGAALARAWLERLRVVLDANPRLEVSFTPPADPDVTSLAHNGLGWASSFSAAARTRITAALGGRTPASNVAWPVDGVLDAATLSTLVARGAKTVIVSDTSLPGGTHSSPRPNALASLGTPHGKTTVAVTSGAIQKFTTAVLARDGSGLGQLPELVSELAVRAIENSKQSHYVLITAPREVDPNPAVAAAAITQSTHTFWSQSLTLGTATRTVTPANQGALATTVLKSSLPDTTISTAHLVTDLIPDLASLIPSAVQRAELLGSLPDGVQRSASAEWASDPPAGISRANALRTQVTAVTGGVHLVVPTTGTYTLGSADSPLPITIDNTLNAEVHVRVQVSAVGGLPGFRADDVGVQQIGPGGKLPLHIPVHVDRAGRMKVQVNLTTPDGSAVGASLQLSVRSTALGDIGKIITFVALGVLIAALLFRLIRRWRKHANGVKGRSA